MHEYEIKIIIRTLKYKIYLCEFITKFFLKLQVPINKSKIYKK